MSDGATLRVSPRDLLDRRAFVRLSPEAKIALCHKAGAPWSDKDPDAKLHDLQKEVLGRPEREKIVHGASRLGKSVLGGCETLCDAILPFTKTAIVAARYDHVSHEYQYVYAGMRNLFRDTPQAFKRLIYRHSQNYHDYECSTIWGAEVRGYSTDSDEGAALLGQAFTRVVLGEGSHISSDILDKKIMRAIDGALMQRSDGSTRETGYLSIYTTPKGYEGCSAAEWDRVQKQTGRKPEKLHYGNVPFPESVWVREANILENPAYDRNVFEARKRSLSKHAFEEQYLGKMTFRTGRIYAEYDEDRHMRPMPPPEMIKEMRLGVGIDTGSYFGAVLVGISKDNMKWVLGEVYTQQVPISESMEQVREMIIEILSPIHGTREFDLLKERVEMWLVDPASQHKMEIIEALDIALGTPSRDQGKFELIPTIDQVRDLFKHDEIIVVDGCDWTTDQIKKYVWKQVKAAGGTGAAKAPVVTEPKKGYDHLLDALRFIIIPLNQLGPLEEIPPPVTLQEAWEAHRKNRIFGPLKDAMRRGERQGGVWV